LTAISPDKTWAAVSNADKRATEKNMKMFAAKFYLVRHIVVGVTLCLSVALAQAQTKKVDKPDLRVGDTWVVRMSHGGEDDTMRIMKIEKDSVYVAQKNSCGRETLVYTTEWAVAEFCGVAPRAGLAGGGRQQQVSRTAHPPRQLMPFPVSEGQSWTSKYATAEGDVRYLEGKALGWEKVTVPAGTFEALKIEFVWMPRGGYKLKETRWYAPEVNNFVKAEVVPEGQLDFELVSYKRADGK
jgi:hypothetical protein